MKKRFFSLLLIGLLLCSLSVCAFAENGKVWNATFTKDGKMTSDFKKDVTDEIVSSMEPGQAATFTVRLKNDNASASNWYMSNKVIKTLEKTASGGDSGASGGTYTYLLTYTSPNGAVKELYNSQLVGGDTPLSDGSRERVGLEEATVGLEEMFFLGQIGSGETGVVSLKVGLDGETLDNAYQLKTGDIVMNFAAEVASTTPGNHTPGAKTGDETNLLPYYVIMIISGLVFLYLALDAITDRIYGRKRG